MAVQRLSVNIGANVAGAVNGINQVNNQLGNLNQTTQRSTRDFTGLSRVIQDLPYGFNGISNNLTQILPAAGAAGLAISAITTAITFATIGFGAWTRGFQGASEKVREHTKAVQEAKQALEDYVGSLEDINQARIKGAQNAQEELVALKTLYDASQNANIPLAKRKELVDELQEQYPKYFGNIKDEIILAGGAQSAYEKLTNAILATARARAAQDILVGLQKDLLAVEEQRISAQNNLNNAKLREEQTVKRQYDLITKSKGRESTAVIASDKIKNATSATASAQSSLNALLKQENELKQRSAKLTGEIQSIVQNNPDSLLDLNDKLPKSVNKEQKISLGLRYDLLGDLNVDKTVTDLFKKLNEAVKAAEEPSEFKKSFDAKLKKSLEKPIPARINIAPKMTPETMDEAEKLGEQVGQMIGKGIAPGFAGMGEAIGAAIASGESPIEAAGRSILGTIGDLISQIGKALIEYGVVKEGLDKILIGGIAIPGVAAIVAGVAAVAVGQLLKTSFKPKKFAEGGLAFGPTLGLIGEGQGTTRSNPEVVAPLDKLKKFIGGGKESQVYILNHKIKWDGIELQAVRSAKHKKMFE